jgi:hypothetical protein
MDEFQLLGFWGFGVLGYWGCGAFGKHIPSSLKLKTQPFSQVILEITLIQKEIHKDGNSQK